MTASRMRCLTPGVFSWSPSAFDYCSVRPFYLNVPHGTKPLVLLPCRINPWVDNQVDAILDRYTNILTSRVSYLALEIAIALWMLSPKRTSICG